MRPFLLAALAGLCVPAALADTITLSALKDNTLFESPTGALSNGIGGSMYVGRTDENQYSLRRGLIAFDLSSIPAGSTVTAATLTLYMDRTRASGTPVTLHRLLASWGEGASNSTVNGGGQGAPAQPGDATWLHRFFSTQLWATPGGDYNTTASATLTVAGNGTYSWTSATLAADVQAWVNTPAVNHGWMIRGVETSSGTAKRFVSREGSNTSRRPRLVVTFTPPSNTGACCLPGGTCQLLTESQCATQGGVYQGNNTSCSPNPCAPITGACCFNDASCQVLSQAACISGGGVYQGDSTTCSTGLCPLVLAPFVDELSLPPIATPVVGQPGGTAEYMMYVREFSQKLHRDLPLTRVWGYASTAAAAPHFPGPTILARRDEPVTVTWINDLRDITGALRTEHYLPVDLCLHGPNMHGASARIVTHLHGGHVPADSDGYPEIVILPGQQSTPYHYPNSQLPGTVWYHDHAIGITRLNVYMGMAGFYLITDEFEESLGLPSGNYEAGLAIQDRSFNPDGTLKYPATWQGDFFGDFMLVNGKVWPYMNVRRGLYRFRMLNGCTSRTLTLSLSNSAGFHIIGTDLGLLPAPVPVTEITIQPGERVDTVIDFSSYTAGTEIILTNSAPTPYPGPAGQGVIPNVMKFIVQSETGGPAALPATLRPVPAIPESEAALSRDFLLTRSTDPCTGSVWLINGMHWDHIEEYPRLNTTEIWSFINPSSMSHPMHMHLVAFQVLDRQTFEMVSGVPTPTGPRVPPPPEERGWKDTVRCDPDQITRVIARFENYLGKWPYHCHILEHEDHEMMRQFQTTCYANCDMSTTPPVLNVADFSCFLQSFAAGNPYANCDGSTTPPVLNVADFSCFLQQFAAGCN
jgi:FtsP/CotA-like multicopper oxidase with cupredoxin domain